MKNFKNDFLVVMDRVDLSRVRIYQTNAEQMANEWIYLPKMGICGQYSKSERAMANAFVPIR